MVFPIRVCDNLSLRFSRKKPLIVEFRRMAILAECDICKAQHRVKDALGGSTIRCKSCGVQLEIRPENVISPNNFLEVDGRLVRSEPVRKLGVWPWIAAGAATGVVVLVLIVAIWIFSILVRFR